ncbi:MAG: hypothetical protein KDJ37_09530 [Hyphomicrobiaceae bacterium]|nr:hypothetical protein [Hyphomicrobiaceae bacterium]
MLDVLVYRSWGPSGLGVIGHVLGTSYTFEITTIDPALDPGSNAFSQLGAGFVFEGDSTSGFDDTLVYSQGNGATPITLSSNGDLITDPWGFSQFAGEVVFLGNSPAISGIDNELYLTNGTGAPGLLLPVGVQGYTIVASTLYALAQDADIYRVNADGSYQIVMDSDAGSLSLVPSYMFEFDDALYFRGRVSTSLDYYRIDPVTDQVVELNIAEANNPNELAIGNTQFFFWNFASATGHELYVSDGTSAGTHLVLDIWAGSSSSYNYLYAPDPRTISDSVIFWADDGGSDDEEFWVSDGTIAGTFRLTGTGTPAGELDASNANATITVGNQVFFTAYRPDVGTELFVTDGTINGTHLVADLFPGTSSSNPRNFSTDGTYLYFSVSSGPDLEAVWVSDGTEAGTQILSVPGGSGSTSASMITVLQLEQENLPPRMFLGNSDPDTFNGEFLNEFFYGLGGDDVISAGAGDDTVFASADFDTIDGGADTDTFDLSTSTGVATNWVNLEAAGSQFRVDSGAGFVGRATLANIENVSDSSGNDRFFGNASDNTYFYSSGFDTFDGNGGIDTLDISAMTAGFQWIDLQAPSSQLRSNDGSGWVANMVVSDVERFVTNNTTDHFRGSAGDETVVYVGGRDFIDGRAGSDTLDMSNFDLGTWVNLNIAFDQFRFHNGAGFASGGNMTGVENVIGSDGNDYFYADANNNTYFGGLGNDRFEGGLGDDTFLLDGTLGDYTVAQSGANYVVNGISGTDTLVGVEFVTLGGTTYDIATLDGLI